MLTICCFKWRGHKGYRSVFLSEHVNTLRRMVARNYADPHEFVCITDDPSGIDSDIRIVPLWNEFSDIPSPHGGNGKNPSCYRRLKIYSTEAEQIIGKRFVAMDLDAVVTGDLRPIFNRTEDIVLWGGTNPKTTYNGSLVLMTAGVRRQVYETFDPKASPRKAYNAGCFGSDQGWISYCLGPKETRWTKNDGIYSFRNDLQQARGLPPSARLVFFHGCIDPWSPQAKAYPWISQHYR